MGKPEAIVGTAVALLIVGTVFSTVPVGKEPYQVTEYSVEKIKSEVTLVHEIQVRRWYYWDDATEVQYMVKNNDTVDGEFILNYIFSNKDETKSITDKVRILAGTKEVVTELSSLNGVSSGNLTVVSPFKSVPYTIIKTKDVYIWDHLWDLKSLFGVK